MSRRVAAETVMVLPIPGIYWYLSRRGALCPGKVHYVKERCTMSRKGAAETIMVLPIPSISVQERCTLSRKAREVQLSYHVHIPTW